MTTSSRDCVCGKRQPKNGKPRKVTCAHISTATKGESKLKARISVGISMKTACCSWCASFPVRQTWFKKESVMQAFTNGENFCAICVLGSPAGYWLPLPLAKRWNSPVMNQKRPLDFVHMCVNKHSLKNRVTGFELTGEWGDAEPHFPVQ